MVKRDRFELSTKSMTGIAIAALFAGALMYKLHLAQKWDAAFIGTLVIFWYLGGVFRARWAHMSFWAAYTGCLVAHCGLMWLAFGVMMRDKDTFGIYAWAPVAMIECIGLYYSLDFFDRKLSQDRGRI
jgi:hypothetical protein